MNVERRPKYWFVLQYQFPFFAYILISEEPITKGLIKLWNWLKTRRKQKKQNRNYIPVRARTNTISSSSPSIISPLHFRNKMELRSEFFMLFLLLSCCFRSSHFTGLRCTQPLTLTLITIIFNYLRDKN